MTLTVVRACLEEEQVGTYAGKLGRVWLRLLCIQGRRVSRGGMRGGGCWGWGTERCGGWEELGCVQVRVRMCAYRVCLRAQGGRTHQNAGSPRQKIGLTFEPRAGQPVVRMAATTKTEIESVAATLSPAASSRPPPAS